MTDHSSMGSGQDSNKHSGPHDSAKRSGGKHGKGKHGKGKHGKGKHGKGKHGKGEDGKHGAHGLLDILEENERDEQRALAAGTDGVTAPDGRAVLWALTLSLLMGVIGGWFLRVSGGR